MISNKFFPSQTFRFVALFILMFFSIALYTQEEAASKPKPVRNTFQSTWLIDQQAVDVPLKGTLEFDINHRFGTIGNGYENLFGIWAPSNIRLGLNYAPVDGLFAGFGLNKFKLVWDFNIKYSLLRQTRTAGVPISITYYGNMAMDTRDKENFINGSDRLSYFHSLIFARKLGEKFSLQISPSLSHFNVVEGYISSAEKIEGKMKNDHVAISAGARIGITSTSSLLLTYAQPITEHPVNNPKPNFGLGYEITTSSHAFQVFFTNYYNLVPQYNNVFNHNRPPLVFDELPGGEDRLNFDGWLIGFNITRLWNF